MPHTRAVTMNRMGTPDRRTHQESLAALLRGYEADLAAIRSILDPDAALTAADELAAAMAAGRGGAARLRAEVIRRIWEERSMSLGQLARHLGVSKARAQKYIESTRSPEEDPLVPEPQPVVAAIVTSALGVLVGRRNDGKPPWTFIAGEIEPGESPADAAVREVKEEAGLLVKAGRIIGRRVHPKTGRTMIYMSARASGSPAGIFVGDEEELAEVRWASLAEAEVLMQPYGMFEPVRAFLARTLR